MTRDIFLTIYHSPLFPAHWGLWIPSSGDPAVGKVIQVTGDAARGFDHEFKRNYSLTNDLRKHSLVLLARVEDKYVVDIVGGRPCSLDKNAVDEIERQALDVPAPGKSLTPVSSQATKAKIQISNCQTWLHDLVIVLVAVGIFPSEAITVLANSPKH